jgi:hypothetical protein
VTILDVGRCLGTGKPPLGGSEESADGRTTGICSACSGRFDLQDGLLVHHETAPAEGRESLSGDEPASS